MKTKTWCLFMIFYGKIQVEDLEKGVYFIKVRGTVGKFVKN